MKKTLSLLLSLVMLLSCFSVLPVSAAESGGLADMIYTEESISASAAALRHFKVNNLPANIESLEELKNSADWSRVNLMGMGLDFLYSAGGSLLWSELDIYKKENGQLVYGPDKLPVKLISKDDISLAFTNLGIYLQRVFYNKYGGLNMYSVENAVAMANMIGNIFYPDFVDLDVANYKDYFTNEVPSANEFFRGVTTLSGLDRLINQNWVTRGKSFSEPVVTMLGGNYITFLDEYYKDGLILGSKILEAMVKKIISVGPVDFIYDLINVFSSTSYQVTYRTPVLALFTHKIAAFGGKMTDEVLNSFDGLLQLIFCDSECYSGASSLRFCPFDFPEGRYNSTTDKDEKLIYLYYYFNLCGRYKNNSVYFENLKITLKADASLRGADKTKLAALIDGFFLGNFDEAIDKAIVPLYKENITTATTSIFDRLKNALMTFMKKIADYFDYLRRLFSGELDYGQGNSPFN